MSSSKIVATLLCSNSQEVVEDAVRSVTNFVDQLVFIDTGCMDNSLKIAKAILGDRLVVRTLAWEDHFGAARNFALACVQELGGAWAMTIDTDERLHFGQIATRDELLHRLESCPQVQTWMVDAISGSYRKERFIRIPTKLRWEGRTHEALCGVTAESRAHLPGIRFSEVTKSSTAFQFKLARDLRILRKELQSQPESGRTWYYLGQTLAGLQQFEGATAAFDRCATIREWDELAAWACFRAAKCLADAKRLDEAVERCAIGLAIDPSFPELAWMSAWCCLKLDQRKKAMAWAQMSIAIGATENPDLDTSRVGFRDLIGWYEGPFEVLAAAQELMGQSTAAEQSKERQKAARSLRESRYAQSNVAESIGTP